MRSWEAFVSPKVCTHKLIGAGKLSGHKDTARSF